ncbi:Gp37 family protein [Kingella negevensis]|uniref:Gp37 family protein n=1 Tax=Kingella TaxID=32257 RepID=UPI002550C450|nr:MULTISPECIES: Gp37 family protein [Kingella]MDK4536454.1 Gp37 family protein [Kingella kingae]MDK4537921.1 Gp37 family protein [Kingella kingae]MDK4547062.1 Gp37 family protein [Kingella kingae]MDK4622844.1 Gp37 family protein [Kingella kingae]MDK4680438.1 Gp37 family protein [Kingella negevensis]
MSATRPIIDAVATHLQAAIPWVSVDVFPENPADYQFIHPVGAVLVGYQSSKFTKLESLGLIAQQRDVVLHLTVIGSHLHGDDGALAILDEVRLAIVGFKPPNCLPCSLLQERFLSEDAGAWQYELTVQTETQQVEFRQPENLPRYAQMQTRQTGEPLNPNLKPKNP